MLSECKKARVVSPGFEVFAADCDAGSDAASPVRLELGAELLERTGIQRVAHFLHQVQVVMQVVDGGQHGAEHLAAAGRRSPGGC